MLPPLFFYLFFVYLITADMTLIIIIIITIIIIGNVPINIDPTTTTLTANLLDPKKIKSQKRRKTRKQ